MELSCVPTRTRPLPLPHKPHTVARPPLFSQGILADVPASLGTARRQRPLVASVDLQGLLRKLSPSFLSTHYSPVWFCTVALFFSLPLCIHKEYRIKYKVRIHQLCQYSLQTHSDSESNPDIAFSHYVSLVSLFWNIPQLFSLSCRVQAMSFVESPQFGFIRCVLMI